MKFLAFNLLNFYSILKRTKITFHQIPKFSSLTRSAYYSVNKSYTLISKVRYQYYHNTCSLNMDKFVTRILKTTKNEPEETEPAEPPKLAKHSNPPKETKKETGRESPSNRRVTREVMVKHDRDLFVAMPKIEKRKLYKCGKRFVELDDILSWKEMVEDKIADGQTVPDVSADYTYDEILNEKVSLFRGDITALEIDAIVNAANGSLLGGGGVDGAIHSAAGSILRAECATLHGCDTGDSKITAGYKLPSRYIIHTVGPIGENTRDLKSCYNRSFELMKENKIRSIAFPCISTGIYGYPNYDAAQVAMKCTREFLEKNGSDVDRVIFCLFLPVDVKIYHADMHKYFPTK